MKKTLLAVITLAVLALFAVKSGALFRTGENITPEKEKPQKENLYEIKGTIKPGETLFDIFKKYNLDIEELLSIKKASSDVYNLGKLYLGRQYRIQVDDSNRVRSLTYCINDDCILSITRKGDDYFVEKLPIEYEKRIAHIGGVIKDNLVSALDSLPLALELSDIFAWDIDFTTDLRRGDTFKVVVEELWLDGEFKKYGNILSAEFHNNGRTYYAYRFEYNGQADYYDSEGKSLRRAFLKAPLSYRRISSGFTKRRFHPILKVYRPHLGVDYAAPRGTPVSAVGDGTVLFAGYKRYDGKQVIIKHPGGYKTYYGHLSRIRKGIRKGVKVKQGQIIGYVGKTGLATGPHLDYRIKKNGRFINPLTLRLPRGKSIPPSLMTEFENFKNQMNTRLASIKPQTIAPPEKTERRS
jgi:murein DD-endopeptidase MepM/ murein hydrolase activator NlpD